MPSLSRGKFRLLKFIKKKREQLVWFKTRDIRVTKTTFQYYYRVTIYTNYYLNRSTDTFSCFFVSLFQPFFARHSEVERKILMIINWCTHFSIIIWTLWGGGGYTSERFTSSFPLDANRKTRYVIGSIWPQNVWYYQRIWVTGVAYCIRYDIRLIPQALK